MIQPFYVLTACTRPANLAYIATRIGSIIASGQPVHWLIAPGKADDPGGQQTKNELIAQVPHNAWLWFCDDDTVPHPKLLPTLREVWAECPDAELIVVSQRRSGMPPDDAATILTASPQAMLPGHVDIGQLIIRRSALDGLSLNSTYDADGQLAEQLAARLGSRVVYRDVIASLHNWVRFF